MSQATDLHSPAVPTSSAVEGTNEDVVLAVVDVVVAPPPAVPEDLSRQQTATSPFLSVGAPPASQPAESLPTFSLGSGKSWSSSSASRLAGGKGGKNFAVPPRTSSVPGAPPAALPIDTGPPPTSSDSSLAVPAVLAVADFSLAGTFGGGGGAAADSRPVFPSPPASTFGSFLPTSAIVTSPPPAFTFGASPTATTSSQESPSFTFGAAAQKEYLPSPLAFGFGAANTTARVGAPSAVSTFNARPPTRQGKNKGFASQPVVASPGVSSFGDTLPTAAFGSLRLSERAEASDDPAAASLVSDAQSSRILWSASRVPAVKVGDVATLTAHDFGPLVASLQQQHAKGTRKWVSEAFLDWLSPCPSSASPSQLFCVLGAAGTGKSVVTVAVLQQLHAKGKRIGAVHFCRHDNPSASSPVALLSSISAQLAGIVPGFGRAVEGSASKLKTALDLNDASALFDAIIADPFRAVSKHALDEATIIVIDALDELPPHALLSVLTLLSQKFILLPPSVKLFVTSREEASIMRVLSKFNPLELRVDELRNKQDLRIFLSNVAAESLNLVINMKDVVQRVTVKWPGFYVADRLRDLKRLEELEEPMLQSRACYDVVAVSIASETGYRDLREIKEVSPWPPRMQMLRVGAGPVQLSEIMADAAEAREILRMIVAKRWEPMVGKPTKQVPVEGFAVPWVDNAIDPGLKGLERAMEKARNDYRGNVLMLKDVARMSLEFKNCSRLHEGFLALTKCPGVKIVSVKNKFKNSTPLGYRDLSLTVEVSLRDERKHLCEVQMNHVEMLVAKSNAHHYYEVVRGTLPLICKSLGSGSVGADEVERFIMDILCSSVLDSALRVLEDKAEGLFIYARLLEEQLKEAQREAGGKLVDFSALKDLPAGLGEMYEKNFERTFGEGMDWEASKKVVAMIVVAREPLPDTLVEKIVGGEGYGDVKRALSLLFPVREGRLYVMHKSVVDWLREGQRFWICEGDKSEANAILASQLWLDSYPGWRCCGVEDSWEYEMEEGEKYAVTYGHVHLKHALISSEGKTVTGIWHAALLERRYLIAPFERVIEMLPSKSQRVSSAGGGPSDDVSGKEDSQKLQLCSQAATAAAGFLIMRQAKMGRIRKFTAELRELLVEVAKLEATCEKTQQLWKLLEDQVAVLGSRFNPAFKDICNAEVFKGAASAMFSNVPMTSPLNHSPAAKTTSRR